MKALVLNCNELILKPVSIPISKKHEVLIKVNTFAINYSTRLRSNSNFKQFR